MLFASRSSTSILSAQLNTQNKELPNSGHFSCKFFLIVRFFKLLIPSKVSLLISSRRGLFSMTMFLIEWFLKIPDGKISTLVSLRIKLSRQKGMNADSRSLEMFKIVKEKNNLKPFLIHKIQLFTIFIFLLNIQIDKEMLNLFHQQNHTFLDSHLQLGSLNPSQK